MTTKQITPALTREQWAARHVERESSGHDMGLFLHGGPGEILVAEHSQPEGASISHPDSLCAVIALANAALPDDDPRRIGKADVEQIRSAARLIDSEWGAVDAESPLHTLADKLAALLPPDE